MGIISRKGAARILFWLGILGVFGQISSGSLVAQPITSTIILLLTVPYLYLFYKEGQEQQAGKVAN